MNFSVYGNEFTTYGLANIFHVVGATQFQTISYLQNIDIPSQRKNQVYHPCNIGLALAANSLFY